MTTTTSTISSLFLHWSLLLSKIFLFRSSAAAFLVTPRAATSRRLPFVQAHRTFSTRFTGPITMTLAADATAAAASTELFTTRYNPPTARRDQDRVIWVGVAPPDWNKDVPRQSESSTEPLLDPAVPVPDPYGWMRDERRTDTTVLNHLHAENAYTQVFTAHLQGLRDKLYAEMLSAIQETDYTLPRPVGDWYYYTRTFQGKSYTVHCRAPKQQQQQQHAAAAVLDINWDGTADTSILPGEQVLLDVNQLAENKTYCAVGTVKHSPSHQLLAYTTDFTGGETCQLFIKDLTTGEIIDHDPTLEVDGPIRWGADDQTLFYLKLDAAHRPFQLYRRKLSPLLQNNKNDSSNDDELLLQEADDLYWMGISKSLDGRYLFVETSSKETSEVHFLDLADDTATLQCIAPRRPKVLYEVEHGNGKWWITSNVGGLPNMALWTAPAVANCQDEWKLVKTTVLSSLSSSEEEEIALFDGGYERSLDSISCFANHVVACGRQDGLPRVWIASLQNADTAASGDEAVRVKSFESLTFEEEAFDVGLGTHYEFDTDTVVVEYGSLVTPTQSIDIQLHDTSQRTVLKERAVPGYDKEQYASQRLTVTSRDGTTEIPVSLVYRKDIMEHNVQTGQPVHVHLYGYGSYGYPTEADFLSTRLPLLDRGIVYVIAHVRGGGEMGRQWYEEPNGAKYLCKKNTFNDFVDVARWLVHQRKLTSPDMLSCEGRSAGGLLIGASINQAPELFKIAVLGVPFVDVVCTMTDASIPLTAIEWEEWGNCNEKKYFQYMMEYSPMQNVVKAKYPACLLTGGLHDPRVQFWEPAKFAAQLRYSQAADSGPVCVKMDMSAGHFSASDRYKFLKELAFDYAFLLDHVGLADAEKSTE